MSVRDLAFDTDRDDRDVLDDDDRAPASFILAVWIAALLACLAVWGVAALLTVL